MRLHVSRIGQYPIFGDTCSPAVVAVPSHRRRRSELQKCETIRRRRRPARAGLRRKSAQDKTGNAHCNGRPCDGRPCDLQSREHHSTASVYGRCCFHEPTSNLLFYSPAISNSPKWPPVVENCSETRSRVLLVSRRLHFAQAPRSYLPANVPIVTTNSRASTGLVRCI